MIEQHRARENGRDRIGDPLPCDIGGATVAGLKDGVMCSHVGGGSDSHPADKASREVGEDVAEHILGDDHIESFRTANELERSGVNVEVLGRDLGILTGDLIEDPAKERKRAKHIRLVHAGYTRV
jgi:hypothetical protein